MAEERTYQGHVYRRNSAGEPWVIAGPAAPKGGSIITDPYKAKADRRADEDQQLQREAATRSAAAADRQANAAERQAGAQELTASNTGFNQTLKLRSDYDAMPDVKEYRVAIKQLAQGLKTGADAAGDNALIYAYAKVMDPGSVVRESEMQMAGSTGSWLESAAANLKKQLGIEGGGQLSPDVRAKLRREMLGKTTELNRSYVAQRRRYETDAQALGVDPERVIGVHDGQPFLPDIERAGVKDPRIIGAAASDQQNDGAATLPGGGAAPPNPWEIGPTGGPIAATGETRIIRDEGLNAKVNALYNAGASKEQIDQVIVAGGGRPLDPQVYNAVQKWRAANPGKAYNGTDATRTEPLSIMNRISGSPAGAFGAHAANALTAGTVGALTGEQGEAALAAMEAMNPNAAIAGTLAGGIAGAGGAEAALAARAPAALARYAPRAADAMYGGLSGFNAADEGEGLQGAATGSLLGAAGGALGERVMGGVGSVARGLRDPAVDYLRSAGVPLTVGQILAQGGAVGRGVKKVEDALTSVPFLGNVVDARRREGIEGFNRAAFDIGAETTGGQVQDYGSAGIRQLDQLKNDAYDQALGPVQIDATDPDLVNDLGATIRAALAIPDVNEAQGAAMAGLQSRIDGAVDPLTDTISGRGFQEAYRGLARTGRERANGDYGHEVGQVMRQGQDSLVGALQRQEPGAYEGFVDANAANRRLNVLADAVNKAKNQDGEMFMPSQLNMADASSTQRLTSKVRSAAGDRPFYDLASAGQDILPSKMGDSGTASRAMVGLALGGGAGAGAGYLAGDPSTGAGMGVAATLALALGGSKGAQALASRVLLDRPDLARSIGEVLQNNARIGGAVGAGSLPSIAQLLMAETP